MEEEMKRFLFLFLATFLFAACNDEDTGPEPTACTSTDECGAGLFCIDGICKDPKCKTTADCRADEVCLPSGICTKQSNIECGVPELPQRQCGPGEACQGYKCTGYVCSPDGATQACWNACHEGNKTCLNGNWTECDAEPKTEEKCGDKVDNDCDGNTDEDCIQCSGADPPIECPNHCGPGQQTCVSGMWSECSAPTDCYCDQPGTTDEVVCGYCGTQTTTCTEATKRYPNEPPTYVWGEYSLCSGEGICETGTQETAECGNCGTQSRYCQSDCTYGEWGECGDEGMCIPGNSDVMACGNCGEQIKICGEDCYWEPWGECKDGAAACQLGDKQTQPCGNCGTQTKFCEGTCDWGDWGDCEDEGECVPGTKDTEPCGDCGTKERTCTNMCTWTPFGLCDGAGQCEPGEVEKQACGPASDKGLCEKGQQQRTCNANCMWNSWGSCLGAVYPQSEICGDQIDQDCNGEDLKQPDQYEPNNTCASCYWIDNNGEDDPPTQNYFPTFDSKGAASGGYDTNDYFCFYTTDNWNMWPTSESIQIELKAQPPGTDGDLYLYKGLSACQADNSIASSITDGGANEKISWGETGDEDTGTYYVRVHNWSKLPNCGTPYTLKIQGLK